MSKQEILDVIRAQEAATARGDSQGNIDFTSADVVTYDLPPPLQSSGEGARNVEGLDLWFSTWKNGVTVTMQDPQVLLDGNLAVVFGLSRMVGTKTDGTEVDSWSRRTVVLRRGEGIWKIVHDHGSFPTAMDGSNLSLTDLKP